MRALFVVTSLMLATSVAHAELPPGAEPPVTLRDPSAIEVSAGLGLISRHFRYNDDVYGFLRDYTLPSGPEVTMRLRTYPGAFVKRNSVLATAFGLELSFDRSFGIESERQNGVRFPTIARVLEANLLLRLTSAGHGAMLIVGYGHHAFELGRTEPSAPDLDNVPDVPSVGYGYIRLGLEGRVALHDRVALDLGAAYLVVRRMGGLTDPLWFPRATAGGMTASLRVDYLVARHVELRAGLTYRRYFIDMHSRPGDRNIAGGALDQYTSAELSVAYTF